MYANRLWPAVPYAAERRLSFPIRVLLYVTTPEHAFNLPGAIHELMGGSGWEQATSVLQPEIYAPDLPASAAIALFGQRFDDRRAFSGDVAKLMTDSGALQRQYDILHFAGLPKSAPWIDPWTRLVILQVGRSDFDWAGSFADAIAKERGPAVLVVASDHADVASDYLFRIYSGIVHNQPLGNLTESSATAGDVFVYFARGEGGDHLLQISSIFNGLSDRVRTLMREMQGIGDGIEALMSSFQNLLHDSQVTRLRGSTTAMREVVDDTHNRFSRLESTITYDHETGAALPMADVLADLPAAEKATKELAAAMPELERTLRAEAERAPRVLNANFADKSGQLLSPTAALVAGRDYELLVDIGPRWDQIESIVEGNAAFPDKALTPKGGGFDIQVVVVSDDLLPHIASAAIFLPAQSGRSIPLFNGKRAEKAGPVPIALTAPKVETGATGEIRARVCLYYEGNLVQSGVLTATVAGDEAAASANTVRNRLLVDYAISGHFQELKERFATRDFQFGNRSEPARVGLNLTLNDDGGGGHRIVAVNRNSPGPGFVPYNTDDGTARMTEARQALLDLYFTKEPSGGVTKTVALAKDNGKELEQFRLDLFALARIGRHLFDIVSTNVETSDQTPAAQWTKKLRQQLADTTVIQIARTAPASYVYPWGLVYTHFLNPAVSSSDGWRFCKIIDEEWPNGRRTAPIRTRCPYNKTPDDHENVICPWGFWGLQHIIEQPLSVLKKRDGQFVLDNAPESVTFKDRCGLAIAVTADPAFGPDITTHLNALGRQSFLNVVGTARSEPEAATLFQNPEIAYILCHGKYDATEKAPYLGIGANDEKREHRIYPGTINGWAQRSEVPNLDAWLDKHPLVIVNGCHTFELLPEQMLNVVTTLNAVGAGGVIGTEVSVQLPVALEFANLLFGYLKPAADADKTIGAGEAMHRIRWDFANKGNLLGLAYTAYCMADLKLVAAS